MVVGLYRSGRKRRSGRTARRDASHTYAAIDLGTNNCRLLIARPTRNGFQVIDAFSRIVRLGEGLLSHGELSDAAIERTIAALHVCAGKMRKRSVDRARCIATEACRRAVNGTRFLERVEAETGIVFEIISPEEEVHLAFVGCRPLIEPWARRAVVLDIGGGSTELSWLRIDEDGGSTLDAWVSLPCGVVSLAERFETGPIDETGYQRMVDSVAGLIEPFEAQHAMARHLEDDDVQMIGTSGTVTTLAGIHLDLPQYDRNQVDGMVITTDELDAVTSNLRAMTVAERALVPCVGRDRADLVVGGAAILYAVLQTWPVTRLSVADRGLREGVLLGMMSKDRVNQPAHAQTSGSQQDAQAAQ